MHRIVIDTDGGVDDALALMLGLAWPEARIEAITTVHGIGSVEQATRNVREVLHIVGRDVSLAQGCASPLSGARASATDVHGSNGLGGWERTAPEPPVSSTGLTAAQAIVSLARQFPGDITLVTIGPLTNAATALDEDPEGFRLLKRIVTMGGAVWEGGNVTAAAEFNVFADPEAARRIFHCGVSLTVVGLDVTRRVVFTRERLDKLLGGRTDLRACFLRRISGQLFSFYKARLGRELCYLHDPLAVGVALDRSLVRTRPMHVDVETKGDLTRGMVVAEQRPWVRDAANADVCVEVDEERFLDLFCSRVI